MCVCCLKNFLNDKKIYFSSARAAKQPSMSKKLSSFCLYEQNLVSLDNFKNFSSEIDPMNK